MARYAKFTVIVTDLGWLDLLPEKADVSVGGEIAGRSAVVEQFERGIEDAIGARFPVAGHDVAVSFDGIKEK